MKKNSIYKQYGFNSLPYPIKDYVDGWMSEYQTIWRISHKNMQIQGKNIFDFILLYGGVFVITLSILNRYDWLLA